MLARFMLGMQKACQKTAPILSQIFAIVKQKPKISVGMIYARDAIFVPIVLARFMLGMQFLFQ